ncbi:hypothetical protein FACS189421_08300 [Bacteroidia bacterium]|nr:hypothetical protein FACS189421_08300 [Bacteroidia bacterium]
MYKVFYIYKIVITLSQTNYKQINIFMDELIKSNGEKLTFEDFKNENGITYWWASDLMQMLGYPNMKSFQKVLDRATKAFVSLNIPHYDNILAQQRVIDGITTQDFKLTRFACYLTVMNGDPKKKEVAQAQSYFAQQTIIYNMASWELEKRRGVKKGKLMDYMGRTELAANLFRITQTEERIKNKGIFGQDNLEQTHYQVGKEGYKKMRKEDKK